MFVNYSEGLLGLKYLQRPENGFRTRNETRQSGPNAPQTAINWLRKRARPRIIGFFRRV